MPCANSSRKSTAAAAAVSASAAVAVAAEAEAVTSKGRFEKLLDALLTNCQLLK